MNATTTTTTTPTDRARATLGAISLISAPVILLIAGAIHPEESSDAARQLDIVARNSGRWHLAHFLFAVGFALLVPAAIALGRRLRGPAPSLQLVGTAVAAMGSIAMVGFMAIEGLGTWELAKVGGPGPTEVLDKLIKGSAAIAPFALIGLGLQAGFLVLAIGLARTKTAPSWVAWTLAAAAIVLAVGAAGQLTVAIILGTIGLGVALAAVGVADLRAGADDPVDIALPRHPVGVGVGR